jgi:predicted O-methyltransferase YrrM
MMQRHSHGCTFPGGSQVATTRATRLPAAATAEEEAIISSISSISSGNRQQTSWAYAEAFVAEDEVLQAGRQRAQEVGVTPIGSGGGAALRLLAAAIDARHVVEIGTGTGVSGVWLLRGMRPDGVLTSVDVEAEHQRLARETFAEAGIPTNRARLITGRALEVLPRLADSGYDLVFCDADKNEYGDYLREALRLLRPGGVVAFDNALWHDRVADPAQRDPETVAIRELGKAVREDEGLVPALLPVGDGLLCAVKR